MTDWDAAGKPSLDHALQAARDAVAAQPDAHEAWRLANRIRDDFRDVTTEASKLRGVAAERIAQQQKLSLRALADELGVTHPTAGKIIREARE